MLRQGVWIAIMLVILSVLPACPHKEVIRGGGGSLKPENNIVGRWEALEPKNGFVNIYDFQPDAKIKSSLLGRSYARYHIEGDKLITVPDNSSEVVELTMHADIVEKPLKESNKSAGKKSNGEQTDAKQDELSKASDQSGEPNVYTFVLENDRLTMTYDKTGEVLIMQREGQALVPDSIVGYWTFNRPAGFIHHQIFGVNGITVVRSPMPAAMDTEAYYEVKGDVITVISPDTQNSQSVQFKLEHGKLVLNDGEKITHFLRLSESQYESQ